MGHWERDQQRQLFEDIGAIIGLLARFTWRQFRTYRQDSLHDINRAPSPPQTPQQAPPFDQHH